MHQRLIRRSIITQVFAGLVCLGCVDPEGTYDDFIARDKKTTLPHGSGCGDPNAACEPATAAGLTDQWLFALSATLSPTKPILFFVDVTATDTGGQLEWTWTKLTPLDAKTREPLSGADITGLPASTIPADGKWSADLPQMDVPGAANPITGSDITADTALSGDVCGNRDFVCGDVSGKVTKPIPLDLAGSTWTLQRLETPQAPETIYVSCSCVEADKLP